MTSLSFARLFPLSLGLLATVSACGTQLNDTSVAADESEFASHFIVSSVKVGGKAEVYNTTIGLNLRSGPGTGYSVLTSLDDGTVVDVVGALQNSFWKVKVGSTTGWAHSNYLREYTTSTGGGAYPSGIHQVPANSGNYTAGRSGVAISTIVIHDTEGGYDGAISWFKNAASGVSAHYVIRSSDGDITQMVSEGNIAWHAGNWSYNQKSIGIEHEGYASAPTRWFTDAMYRRSAQLSAAISKRYGFAVDRTHIIGHADVPPPSNHTDPGTGWDWNKYIGYVKGYR